MLTRRNGRMDRAFADETVDSSARFLNLIHPKISENCIHNFLSVIHTDAQSRGCVKMKLVSLLVSKRRAHNELTQLFVLTVSPNKANQSIRRPLADTAFLLHALSHVKSGQEALLCLVVWNFEADIILRQKA